jgi:hypothetical protein
MKKSDCPFKLPLHIPEHVTGTSHVYLDDADGKPIALVLLLNYRSQGAAAYIVQAVNYHESLVAMLDAVCIQYENVRAAENYPTSDSVSIRVARALLAELEKAKP